MLNAAQGSINDPVTEVHSLCQVSEHKEQAELSVQCCAVISLNRQWIQTILPIIKNCICRQLC